MRRRFLVVLAAALVVVGFATVAPAAAHIELEGSDPAPGATLTAPPASLSLTFSATPVAVSVEVLDPGGQPLTTGELVRQGAGVVVPLPALDQPGTYTVNWRAANDQHPFTGSYTVTLDLPVTTTTEAPSTTSTSGVAATDSLPAGSGGTGSQGGGGTPVPLVAAGLVVLGLLAGAVVVRRRRRDPSPSTV